MSDPLFPDDSQSLFPADGAEDDALFAPPSEVLAPMEEPEPSEPETALVATPGKDKKKDSGSGQVVLGVSVQGRTLHGVLMRSVGDGYRVIRRFERQRSMEDASAGGFGDPMAIEDDLAGDDGVMLSFNESAGGEMFMPGEFGALAASDGLEGAATAGMAGQSSAPFVFELKDMVEECRALGFEKPALSFSLSLPDVDYVEVIALPEKEAKKKDAKKEAKKAKQAESAEGAGAPEAPKGTVKRDRLIELLADLRTRPFPKDRVQFVEMTPREGKLRYLAVVPEPGEPVAESLKLLREQDGMKKVPFKSIDAEVSLLTGLVRLVHPPDASENTAIVRVGSEDTLVILLEGEKLHHAEHMRSVTTIDGPDTICSRVLLQQDVQGIGSVHRVVLLSEAREEELVGGFSAFYPDARVGSLREGMAALGIGAEGGELPTESAMAVAAALKVLARKDARAFSDVDMLPKALRRRAFSFKFAPSWHTLVVAVLLFLGVVFLIGRYVSQQNEINAAEARLAEYPAELSMTGDQIQAEIDANRAQIARVMQALATVDSLLIGSDRWTQSLARTSTATTGTGGIWLESYTPLDNTVTFQGYATSRAGVVELAERMSGSIEQMSWDEIREMPVYRYTIQVPVPAELPQVARYLREQAGGTVPDAIPLTEPLLSGVSRPANPTPDGEEAGSSSSDAPNVSELAEAVDN